MIKVAGALDVSGSYLARVCTALRVPRPQRGYWAKLAVGKAPAVQPLPPAQAGDPLEWSKGTVLPPFSSVRRTHIEPARRSKQSKRVTGTHALISNARRPFENGRPVDEHAYLKPFKKHLVDLTTSKAALERGLELANDVFNALESTGYRVMLAPHGEGLGRGYVDPHVVPKPRQNEFYPTLWSPSLPTVAYVDTIAIGLSIVEMCEPVLLRYVNGKYVRESDYVVPKRSRHFIDHSWTTTQDRTCGRFRLVAYAPYRNVSWSTHWQETGAGSLR
jgi:hypothetical protein